MADLSVTAANVALITGLTGSANSGVAIGQGKSVSVDPSDGLAYLYEADSTTAARRVLTGVALTSSAIGQPCVYAAPGAVINPGATVAAGAVYVGSATPGGIAPVADLTSGMYTSILGVGLAANRLQLAIVNSGVAVP